ncbi:MAG: hypothetical protein SCK57_03730 [Bacillota bacterium]|nr:hypothetical protein [Bacillota bacterium]MDW7676749.1 hypothetical protein [Bacillota bacterium]
MSWLKLLLKDIIDDGSNFGEQHIPMEGSSAESDPVEMWIPGKPATFALGAKNHGRIFWRKQSFLMMAGR